MRFRPLLLVVLLAPPAAAQAPDTTHRAPGATVSGVVRDSIARMPLAGATVQLFADGLPSFIRTAVSDSMGRFTLADVPDGRFTLGFLHPMLDSLGVEAPLREVFVDGHRPVRADLAIPSPARLRAAICGPRSALDSGAVLVGIVRDAQNRAPVAGVTVIGEWLELSFRPDGMVRRIPRLVATTGENGWFAMCNVPSAGTMSLIATRGADSTDLIEVQVPAEGFLRRELYLGPARTVVMGDTIRRADSLAPLPRRVRVGDGRLSGTVVAAAGAKPLVGAQVSITGGPQTRTNERGEWTLVDAPAGTRMLEVRALGYFPERRRVDVVDGMAPLRVALSTLKSVLDTVRISATRRMYDRDSNGFQRRRRSGIGHYLAAVDIARQMAIVTSDLFRMIPGVRMERDPTTSETQILVRGNMAEWCSPTVYIDGRHLVGSSADDIDMWVRPKNVAGVEVYSGLGAPLEYQEGMTGCGSILIWTK